MEACSGGQFKSEVPGFLSGILILASIWLDGGAIIKDTCWLQPIKNTQHINMAELDAVLRGVNLTLKWQAMVLQMNTGSTE